MSAAEYGSAASSDAAHYVDSFVEIRFDVNEIAEPYSAADIHPVPRARHSVAE